MFLNRAVAIAVLAVCLSAPTSAHAQNYCPVYFIGQFGNSYYYDCQVCNPGVGQGNNCAPQNVWFNAQVPCNGSCESCGGNCTGEKGKAAPINPVLDDTGGLDLYGDNNTADAEQDQFLLAAPVAAEPVSQFSTSPQLFYVTVTDPKVSSTIHYFKCYLIRNKATKRWLCVGREQKTPVDPATNMNLPVQKVLDANHIRVQLTSAPDHAKHKPYCYLTTSQPWPK